MQDTVKLGQRVRDKVTQFEGVVIALATHLTGCDTVGVNPGLDKDGKMKGTEWFDHTRLIVLEERSVMDVPVEKENRGGPQEHPNVM